MSNPQGAFHNFKLDDDAGRFSVPAPTSDPLSKGDLEQHRAALPPVASIVRHTIDTDAPKTVHLGEEHQFVFVARDDAQYVVDSLAPRIVQHHGLSEDKVRRALRDAYVEFVDETLREIARGLYDPADLCNLFPRSAPGRVEVHVYDAEPLAQGVKARAAGCELVSLDPLIGDGAHELAVSRLFYIGGLQSIGITHRPGSPSLAEQCKALRERIGDKPLAVTDDDIYTGGTLRRVLQLLDRPATKAIPQIQTGNPDAAGVPLDPVVTYVPLSRERMDIGDVRDFLLGASGLVVQLPSGEQGRLPYVLPFVSPAARASIHRSAEASFSARVLELNARFFAAVEAACGIELCVKDLEPALQVSLEELYGVSSSTPVQKVLRWARRHMDSLWSETKAVGVMQAKLDALDLPDRMVLLDVNGTLIPDELRTRAVFSKGQVAQLQQRVESLEAAGVPVGLCSDSPLPQLRVLAGRLGLRGPIFAENGNIVEHAGRKETLRSLPGREELVDLIREYAAGSFREIAAVTAPEFGGREPNFERGEWAFGAGRESSLSVMGPPELIRFLGDRLSVFEGYSVDCSPEYHFLCIHVGEDYRRSKGDTLRLIARFGHATLMVGNSLSDWVEPDTGVKCAFVGNARIPEHVRGAAAFVSHAHCFEGVLEILSTVQLDSREGP